MATEVVMPQMGESIAEGTIVRWIKKIGDNVDRDEPLFEISTDKVDAEIPSPAAGVLTEIKVREGETVPVNSVVATIAQAGEAPPPPAASAPAAPAAVGGALTGRRSVAIPGLPGSRIGVRGTKRDIPDYLRRTPIPAPAPAPAVPTPTHVPAYQTGDRVDIQPMSVIRKKIAEHMILSRRT